MKAKVLDLWAEDIAWTLFGDEKLVKKKTKIIANQLRASKRADNVKLRYKK